MAKPLLFFDTNVARKLKSKSAVELGSFWTWIRERHRYAITPLVIAEVLKSLREDPEQHLEEVRRELCMLRGPGRPIVLPLPGIFLGRTLFDIRREHPTVSARTMAEVFEAGRRIKRVVRRNGQVLLVESLEYRAIVLDYIIDPILDGEESMFAALEAAKRKKAEPLEPEEWAHHVLADAGLPTTVDACRILSAACSAAYQVQRFLWTHAVKRYNPRKHPGDWMDKQLLLYLAYPKAVFVTCETKLPRRIAGSGQENRVVSFDDLWRRARE